MSRCEKLPTFLDSLRSRSGWGVWFHEGSYLATQVSQGSWVAEQHGETFFCCVNRWQLNVFSCFFRHLLGLNICLMPAFPRRPAEPQLWGLPIKCMMIYLRTLGIHQGGRRCFMDVAAWWISQIPRLLSLESSFRFERRFLEMNHDCGCLGRCSTWNLFVTCCVPVLDSPWPTFVTMSPPLFCCQPF